MSWTAPAGVPAAIPMLVVGVLLTACGVAHQPDPLPTRLPTPTSCNCVVRIPVRPLDPVPPIVVHPLTKLASDHPTTAPPPRRSLPAPAPPHKRHHRRHPPGR